MISESAGVVDQVLQGDRRSVVRELRDGLAHVVVGMGRADEHVVERVQIDDALDGLGLAFSFAARGQASGLVFIRMKDWRERPGKRNRVQAVAARANAALGKISDAQAFAFAPPAALELGNATGFDVELVDLANQGHDKLMAARNQLLDLARKDSQLTQVRANGLDDEPQYLFNVDWEKASTLGLTIADINSTLSAACCNFVSGRRRT